MVNEVNKIIGNALLSGKEICIDGIGTLFTVRYAAYRASRKSITPPYRVVTFCAEQRGVSLKEEIARVANIEPEKASEIFEHWLSESLDGDKLTINGVGSVHHDKFTIDKTFAAQLNPQGHTPIRLKPKANVGLYVFASLCMAFALGVAGYVYFDNHEIDLFGAKNKAATTKVVAQSAPLETAEATESQGSVAEATVSTEESSASAPEVAAVAAPGDVPSVPKTTPPAPTQTTSAKTAVNGTNVDTIQPTVVGQSYVVLGVFSTTENAQRAIRQAQKLSGDVQCSVYYYGSKFMVALYDAPSRSECQNFAQSVNNTFKDLWVYTRK